MTHFAALRDRPFRQLWTARVVSDFGAGATLSTVLVVLARQGHGPGLLALNGLAQAVPAVALAWIGGGLVDRYDRRRVMVGCDLARGVVVLGYVLAIHAGVWAMFAVSAVQGAIGAFFAPASSAYIASIVRAEDRPAAMGVLQSGSMVAGVAGAGLGGVLAASQRLTPVGFVVDAATFVVAALLVLSIRVVAAPRPALRGSLLSQAREGARFVCSEPVVLVTIVAVATTMISFAVVNASFAPLLLVQLDVTSAWLGPFEAVFVATAFLVGLAMGPLSRVMTHERIFLLALLLFAVGIGGMAVAQSVWMLLPTQVFTGAGQAMVGVAAAVMWQGRTPDELRGRVFAMAQTAQSAATIVGLALVAVVATVLTTRPLIAGAAGLLVLSLCITFATFRSATAAEQSARALASKAVPETVRDGRSSAS